MVMSGSGERVVFVHDRPGDESLITGGTIARLRSAGARVVVLFGASAADDSAAAPAALAELDVSDWRMLPAASVGDQEADRRELGSALHDVLAEVQATAVVIGTDDERLRGAATLAAHAAGVPTYLSRRVSPATGRRLTAIDVSDHVERKLRAVSAYASRWTVEDRAVSLADGSLIAITGTETYLRLDAPRDAAGEAPPTRAGRLLASAVALFAGAVFGLLGTIAHQSTLVLGPVTVPVGLVLALVAVSTLLVGLRLMFSDRLVVSFCAIGLLGTIFLLSLRSEGGSVLVPAGLWGTLWTIVPALVATFVLAWPKIPAKR